MSDVMIDRIKEIAEAKRFFGELKQPNAQATTIKESCGEMSGLQLRIEDGVVREAGYMSFGCGYSQAAHSLACELAQGKTLAQIRSLTPQDIEAPVGGFPEHKFHYLEQVVRLLNKTVDHYEATHAAKSYSRDEFDPNREVKCGWEDGK